MTARLEACGVTARMPGGTAMGPLSLALHRGQWAALVGPNGGGKTTLLRALLGLTPLESGGVLYAGRPLVPGPSRLRQVCALLQTEPAPALSVIDVVSLGLAPGDTSTTGLNQVQFLLEAFDLRGCAQHSCRRLSGGQWQRVRLARTFVGNPAVVVLDEPTNHLDADGCRRALCFMREHLRDSALLCATHEDDLIEQCDQVLWVEQQVTRAPARAPTPQSAWRQAP